MNKEKLKLKKYLIDQFGTAKIALASTGNGINIFADVTSNLTQIDTLCEKAGLSCISTPSKTNAFTGEVLPAKAWIGVQDRDISDEDYLNAF
jgi:hypothetical protein